MQFANNTDFSVEEASCWCDFIELLKTNLAKEIHHGKHTKK